MKFILAFILNTFNHGWQAAVKKYRSITSTSLDEMVFENREKEYGAYMLRKNYPWHLVTALGLAGSLFLYACFLPIWLGWMKAEETFNNPRLVCGFPICPIWHPPEIIHSPFHQLVQSGKDVKVKTVAFQIPKPSPPDEITFPGNGIDKVNTIDTPFFKTDPYEIPDTMKNDQDLKWDGLSTDFFIQERYSDEIPEVCFCDEEPDPKAFIFVDEEPIPINMDEVSKCIGVPVFDPDRSSFYVFRILVDAKGNYQKHLIIKGDNSLLQTSIETCLLNLTFTPAIQEGRPIPFWINIPFRVKTLGE